MKKLIIIIQILLFLLTSCENKDDYCNNRFIKKYKNPDYVNYVSVCLSEDKSGVTCYPGKNSGNASPDCYMEFLHKDYILDINGCLGDAVVNIKRTEYIDSSENRQTLYSKLLDADPYEEIWLDDNKVLKIEYNADSPGRIIDTAKLNQIIDAGEMSKYFAKVK